MEKLFNVRRSPRRRSGFTIVELLVSISALTLGLIAAYSAQLSAMALSNFARETDLATFASMSAMDSVTARPFIEMIDPNPVLGSVDTNELIAMQPPYDPRGFNKYHAESSTYPDAPTKDYISANTSLHERILLYGARIWEPVTEAKTKIDPANNLSYKLYPLGSLQKPKVLVWFEPRPTLMSGASLPYQSTIVKNNSLGYPALVPALGDLSDISSGQPTTVVTAVGWFPVGTKHDAVSSAAFNPLFLFDPPSDGSATFTAAEIASIKSSREALKAQGLRIVYNRTVVRP